MERRHFLKLALGFVAGGAALAASAQAAPLMPAPLVDDGKLPANPDGLAPPQVLGLASPPPPLLAPPSPLLAPPLLLVRQCCEGRDGTRSPCLCFVVRCRSIFGVVSKFAPVSIVTPQQKSPASARLFVESLRGSVSAAASIAPHGAVRAPTAGPYHDDGGSRTHHDDRRRPNHDGSANRLAAAIGTASPAGAASARGIRGAKAGKCARDQNCCSEKILHVFSHIRPSGLRGGETKHGVLNGT